MGFWNKLGKIALTAAPYVAAPFTGGASLAATGLANKAVSKWSQKDAEKNMAKGLAPSKFDAVLGKVGDYAGMASSFMPSGALGKIGMLGKAGKLAGNAGKVAGAAKGLSNFQKIMGGVSAATGGSYNPQQGGGESDTDFVRGDVNRVNDRFRTPDFNPNARGGGGGWQESLRRALNPDMQITGYGGGTMRFPMGGGGGQQGGGGGWQDALGGILGGYGRQALEGGGGGNRQPSYDEGGGGYTPSGPRQAVPRNQSPIMPRGGYRWNENPMNQLDQNSPNLAQSIFQGRQEAIRNQPFRGGYDVRTLHPGSGDEEDMITTNPMPPIYPNRRRQQAAY